MSDVAESPGARLKAERERRGLSAQKAADEMHLDAWVIDALEAGDYARIGAPVYAKGHLKKYVTMLGLPQAELLADFENKSAAKGDGPRSLPLGSTLDTPPQFSASPAQAVGLIAVIVLGAGVFWWKPWRQHENQSAPSADNTAMASTAAASEPAQDSSEQSAEPSVTESASAALVRALPVAPAQVVSRGLPKVPEGQPVAVKTIATLNAPAAAPAAAKPAPAEADASVPGAGHARLKLSFTSDSWVDVRDAQGNRTFAGNGAANSVKTIAGEAPMHVYLKAGSGVQLEINGHTVAIGPQFFAGDSARFEAGADGVLRREPKRDPATRPPG